MMNVMRRGFQLW